jgi:L-rhamnonate dehydratase
MKITDVDLFRLHGKYIDPGFPAGDRQAQPLDIYDEFNGPSWEKAPAPAEVSAIYVEIGTDAGVSGIFGPIQGEQADIIRRFLRSFLLGRDPLATELLFDQMLRLNRHGRSGMFMTGLSAVDCALWDLKGKAWDLPVHRILGGPTRPAVAAYASMLGFSADPEQAALLAAEYKEKGFQAQKWFFRHGPGGGAAGMERNVALAAAVRQAVGPYYPLMFDAFMGWDLPYATRMVRALAPFDPTWMEEPVAPERVGTLARLRQVGEVPIATGEHVYTRWQARELLQGGAVDVLQTDPDWTGGISELVKIAALSSAFDVPLVAHGHSLLPALQVAGSQSPAAVPYVEYLVRAQEDKQTFHNPVYRPVEGMMFLPQAPGLGLVLDQDRIIRREKLA